MPAPQPRYFGWQGRFWNYSAVKTKRLDAFFRLQSWLNMNHADPNTMRDKARGAVEFLKNQLLETGTVEPLVALFFDNHIEQIQFEDPSILQHFDRRTMKSFDYVRRMVNVKQPQTAMVALDVRMGRFESEEVDAMADTTAIFLMLDSPLLTIQVIVPYLRSGRAISLLREQFTEMPGENEDSPCLLFKLFSDAPLGVS